MDIIDLCYQEIDKKIAELDSLIEAQRANEPENETTQTQTFINTMSCDTDNNLDRILDQQAQLKMIIEKDGRIVSLHKQIAYDKVTIDHLRKNCAKLEQNGLKTRQELLEEQAKELERFQMQQLRSISEDYKRHQEVLETRKKELAKLQKEVENEENNRETYLASYAKDQDKSLQARKQMRGLGSMGSIAAILPSEDPTADVNDENYMELETINEYAPYGATSSSRLNSNAATRRRSTATRARRGRGARGSRITRG